MTNSSLTWDTVNQTARDAYGRLLAWLAWHWGDISASEDALSDAFLSALETWPARGIPENPPGWLLTVAKRKMILKYGRERFEEITGITEPLPAAQEKMGEIPDARLRLMFVCAHPAIDSQARTALMLQTVLGIEANRIAAGYLVTGEAMAKRLTRAKAKIRDAGIPFEFPSQEEMPARVSWVLEAIYGAYTLGWDSDRSDTDSLSVEAVFLAELVSRLLPDEPEAKGLAALLDLCEARQAARVSLDGNLILLEDQDCALWDERKIAAANLQLAEAARSGRPGRFQLEAAIQSAHCSKLFTGSTPWREIVQLYELLLRDYPSTGALLGYAVAQVYGGGSAETGIQILDDYDNEKAISFQAWWAVRGHLFEVSGRPEEALDAYGKARELGHSRRLRRSIEKRMEDIQQKLSA